MTTILEDVENLLIETGNNYKTHKNDPRLGSVFRAQIDGIMDTAELVFSREEYEQLYETWKEIDIDFKSY